MREAQFSRREYAEKLNRFFRGKNWALPGSLHSIAKPTKLSEERHYRVWRKVLVVAAGHILGGILSHKASPFETYRSGNRLLAMGNCLHGECKDNSGSGRSSGRHGRSLQNCGNLPGWTDGG